jgi:hypothetical protein
MHSDRVFQYRRACRPSAVTVTVTHGSAGTAAHARQRTPKSASLAARAWIIERGCDAAPAQSRGRVLHSLTRSDGVRTGSRARPGNPVTSSSGRSLYGTALSHYVPTRDGTSQSSPARPVSPRRWPNNHREYSSELAGHADYRRTPATRLTPRPATTASATVTILGPTSGQGGVSPDTRDDPSEPNNMTC